MVVAVPLRLPNNLALPRQQGRPATGPGPDAGGASASFPVDLETIVLKAISKSREQRYNTAQELADDLQRFLDGKSPSARRPTLWERTNRWVSRHRRAVTAAVLVMLVALMALTACGRRGNLEAPPSATVIVADEDGELVEQAPAPEDKPFILDPLL